MQHECRVRYRDGDAGSSTLFHATPGVATGVTGHIIPRPDYFRVYGLGQFILRGILWPTGQFRPNYTPMISITISVDQGRPSHGGNEAEIFIIAISGGRNFFSA